MALLWWWRVRGPHSEGVRSKGRFLIDRSVHLPDTGKLGVYSFCLTGFELNMELVYRFDRRFRIYEMSDYGETIRTYKRLADEEVVDEMALAGRGAPEPYTW